MPTVYGVGPATSRSPVCASRGTVLQRRRDRGGRAGRRARAGRGRRRSSAATIRSASRQGQPAVVPGDRHRRTPAHGTGRCRRPAGAGSQQPDLRPAQIGDPPARGLAGSRRTRSTASTCTGPSADDGGAGAAARPAQRPRIAARATSRSSCRRNCWPSSSGRSSCSRSSWWRSRRSRSWSAASGS